MAPLEAARLLSAGMVEVKHYPIALIVLITVLRACPIAALECTIPRTIREADDDLDYLDL
jgi:hypothetical protein